MDNPTYLQMWKKKYKYIVILVQKIYLIVSVGQRAKWIEFDKIATVRAAKTSSLL